MGAGSDRLNILLTNDDGIFAPGLRALRKALLPWADVTVVAPVSEQSAVGHSITLLQPLMAEEVKEEGEWLGWAVDGKPADCVKLALVRLLPEPPDLVISGINAGSNAGINVLYSGTVAAAIEAAFYHLTAIAVSLELPDASHFEPAADIACRVVRQLLEHQPKPGDLFNVNIPHLGGGPPAGIRVTPQGLVCYRECYEERIDPRGRRYYWLLPDALKPTDTDDNDLCAMAQRLVTVTPLHYDLTARARLESMRSWRLTLP